VKNLNDYVTSAIRTFAPWLAGALIGWAATFGLEINEDLEPGLTGVIIFGCSAAYYLFARWAETKWSWAGWLLGSPKRPVYEPAVSPQMPANGPETHPEAAGAPDPS
jgi:hypothetical protein